MDERVTRLLDEANRAGVSFLLTDLKTVSTLLDMADATAASEETRLRNRGQALDGYRTVLHHLPRVRPSPEQQHEIDVKLAAIRLRLKSAGTVADSEPAPTIPEPQDER